MQQEHEVIQSVLESSIGRHAKNVEDYEKEIADLNAQIILLTSHIESIQQALYERANYIDPEKQRILAEKEEKIKEKIEKERVAKLEKAEQAKKKKEEEKRIKEYEKNLEFERKKQIEEQEKIEHQKKLEEEKIILQQEIEQREQKVKEIISKSKKFNVVYIDPEANYGG